MARTQVIFEMAHNSYQGDIEDTDLDRLIEAVEQGVGSYEGRSDGKRVIIPFRSVLVVRIIEEE